MMFTLRVSILPHVEVPSYLVVKEEASLDVEVIAVVFGLLVSATVGEPGFQQMVVGLDADEFDFCPYIRLPFLTLCCYLFFVHDCEIFNWDLGLFVVLISPFARVDKRA